MSRSPCSECGAICPLTTVPPRAGASRWSAARVKIGAAPMVRATTAAPNAASFLEVMVGYGPPLGEVAIGVLHGAPDQWFRPDIVATHPSGLDGHSRVARGRMNPRGRGVSGRRATAGRT